MIKHFSKWLKSVPLPNCSSEAYAFLDREHSRFSVPTEVLIDKIMWGIPKVV
jgi:hypothetical protein